MRVLFKLLNSSLNRAREDLLRPHPFAYERVGYLSCRAGTLKNGGVVILAHSYYPVDDNDYIEDDTVGAMMGPGAIRKALQTAYNCNVCMFHVHMHNHSGKPQPSHIDLRETAKFVPDFWHVRPSLPHGAIILSSDSLSGRCWYPGSRAPAPISQFTIVGPKLTIIRN